MHIFIFIFDIELFAPALTLKVIQHSQFPGYPSQIANNFDVIGNAIGKKQRRV